MKHFKLYEDFTSTKLNIKKIMDKVLIKLDMNVNI